MKTIKTIIDGISTTIKTEDEDLNKLEKIISIFNVEEPAVNSRIDNEDVIHSCNRNAYFKEIYILLSGNFPITKNEPLKSMVIFYTHSSSRISKRQLGLAWLYFAKDSTSVRMYLRNVSYIEYPENLTKKLIDYKINNWGFPIFNIMNSLTSIILMKSHSNYINFIFGGLNGFG
ncbi:MAG: hypothetical protein FJW68_09995 [Actinobacteria bacterium]|nr:hypothetical protein [Actinomycetota bacterium]